MVFRMIVTYLEREYIIYKKYFGAETKSFSFQNGLFEVREINNTLEAS